MHSFWLLEVCICLVTGSINQCTNTLNTNANLSTICNEYPAQSTSPAMHTCAWSFMLCCSQCTLCTAASCGTTQSCLTLPMNMTFQEHPIVFLPSNLEPLEPFTLTTFALALLLAFRLDASYTRFMTARELWGSVILDSRNLVRQVCQLTSLSSQNDCTATHLCLWHLTCL